ncbi:MAG: hypothetical protein EPO61_05120 [Nitrospirae bacterium]|nr:MAG: hypothetical protein EPO61_05120 [Nitrospirota bacterium]
MRGRGIRDSLFGPLLAGPARLKNRRGATRLFPCSRSARPRKEGATAAAIPRARASRTSESARWTRA